MALTDRLAYIVTADPRQAVAGFGQVGQAAGKAAQKADAEMARLQKRVDGLARQSVTTQKQIDKQMQLAARAQGKGDMLGADVARIRAKNLGDQLGVLQARSRDAQFGLERMHAPATTLGGRLRSVGIGAEAMGIGAAIGGAALVQLGVDAAKAADRLRTAQRGTEAIFQGTANVVREFGEGADRTLGLSEERALAAANAFGNVFVKAGASAPEAAKLAQGLTALSAVLSAANPAAGSTEDALVALRAAFRGEFDPLEKFNVKINATTAETKAMAMGLATSTAALTEQDKILATLQLVYEKTNIEQQLFAKNAESLAFQEQQAAAAAQNLKTEIGERLLGTVGAGAQAIGNLANDLERLADKLDFTGDGGGKVAGVFKALFDPTQSLAATFNRLHSGGGDTAATLAKINELNVGAKEKALAAAASAEEQAAALKKVTAAGKDALSAGEALLDVDDRIVEARKDAAEAADDVAEKERDLAAARRDEAGAARDLADAEEAIERARKQAPRDLDKAKIAARDAVRSQSDAQKEYDKVLRRRGANDPKTLAAQDALALATIETAEAQERINELQGKAGVPKSVQDAIDSRDAALDAKADAEKRTAEVLARNPYEAQQKAAKDLRDAERDRLVAVSTLNEKLILVSAEIRAGFDATKATREQVELMVDALGRAVGKQAELNAVRAVGDAAAIVARDANPGPLAMPGAQQVTPDPGVNPNTGIPFIIGASPRVAAAPAPEVAPRTVVQAQYTGGIVVQANDPAEFERQMAARQRHNRLGGL